MLAKLGVWEILAIVAIITLVFGAKKLPDLGDSFGKTINNFKRSVKGEEVVEEDAENQAKLRDLCE